MTKKVLSLLLVAVLSIGLLPSLFSPVLSAAPSSIDEAKDMIKEYQEKYKLLEAELKKLEAQKDSYVEQKQLLEQQIGELESEISAYDQVIADLDAEIAALDARCASAQAEYDKNIDKFRAQARASYESGTTTYLEVLLGAGSFSEFLLRLDYVKQVALYERELLDKIMASMASIREAQAEIEVRKVEAKEARNVLKARKSEVDAKSSQISAIIKTITSNEALLEKQQDMAHKQEEELNDWIEKELAGADSDVKYDDSKWIWPVAKASYNYVSSGYGWRTLRGKRQYHYGIDIAAPKGTPIYASKSGKVKSAKWVTTGGGWQVCIDHGGTYYTYYNHMNSRPIVKAGQMVSQGQVIGYVGTTGNSTGYHLDFRIYYQGKAVNPANYIKNPY